MITLSKVVSLGFLSMGIFILIQVILPIISFQVWALSQKYQSQILISPVRSKGEVLGVSIQDRDNFPAFVSSRTRKIQPNYDSFTLSVPRLKIENSTVLLDSNDLSKGLAHLPGSALPGERGNVFISGHSAISPLFSLKSAVFERLWELQKGDRILVEAGSAKFVYQIIEQKVVDPADLSVINPPERLVVVGKML